MYNSPIVRSVLVIFCLGSSACGLLGSSDQSELAGEDGGPGCEKDREALSEILVQPQACTVTADCPGGAFCDTTGGECDWECFTNSDCGFGFTCSCDGRCLDGGPVVDGGVPVDPSCPRELSVLTSLTEPIAERTCIRDEHCPYGAGCDAVTRYCGYACLSNADCTGAGDVCDCRGQCVVPGAGVPVVPDTLPTTTITPTFVVVPEGDTWGKQTIAIRLATTEPGFPDSVFPPSEFPLGVEARAYVETLDRENLGHMEVVRSEAVAETVAYHDGIAFSIVEADRAVAYVSTAWPNALFYDLGISSALVTAIIAGRPYSNLSELADIVGVDASTLQKIKTFTELPTPVCAIPPSATLTLSGGNMSDWVVDTSNGYTATASVSIVRCPPTGPTEDDTAWDIAVSTYLVDPTDERVLAHLSYEVISIGSEGAAPDTTALATGAFEGVAMMSNGATGLALSVPVRAWATNSDEVVFFDDLRLLSAAGRFVVSASHDYYFVAVDQATDGISGVITARVDGWQDHDVHSGRMTGSFQLTLASTPDEPLDFHYVLTRLGDPDHPLGADDSELASAQECSGFVACPPGTKCGPLLCEPGFVCETALGPEGSTDEREGRCVPDLGVVEPFWLTNTIAHPTEEDWRTAATFLEYLDEGESSKPTRYENVLCYGHGHAGGETDPLGLVWAGEQEF